MVFILPPKEGIGGALGKGVGEGLSSGLKLLLQNKLQGMQQQRKTEMLDKILNRGGVPQGDQQAGTQMDAQGGINAVPVGRGTGDISDEQILAINAIDPNMARVMQSQKESSERSIASRFKETKEVRTGTIKQARAASENDMRLDRMNVLNESGKLITPLYNSILKKMNMDIAVLKNPESEEYDKLTNDMFRNIRDIFGARITNLEVSAFLKTIPTLSNTEEGRRKIISNLKTLNKGAKLRLEAQKSIIKANMGTPPYDLGEQIEEKIGPALTSISETFAMGSPEQNLGSFATLPEASGFKGKTMKDTETGKRFRSDGTKWEEIE